MKQVKATLISTGTWLRGHTRMHTLVAVVVFAVGFGATIYYWNNLRHSVNTDMDTAYERQARAIGHAAAARLQLYENLLRGSAGLFVVNDFISQADWNQYHQRYNIPEHYPDIEGIGLSRYLTKEELPEYIDLKQERENITFTVFPAGDREVYVPVVLNTPFTGNNGKSKGYDGYTDDIRRKAMDRALDTGQPAISGKVTLVSESRPNRASLLIYMPVYEDGEPTATVDERRTALLGFTYMAIDAKSFLDAVLQNAQSAHVGLKIYDAALPDKESLLYASNNFDAIRNEAGAKVETTSFEAYGHKWQMTLAASPEIISEYERQLPGQAMWRGILSALFFAGLVWYLITDRERKYARQKQEEVQTAKDDLLSLASHQLRTPATVVKQYVGMLLQGYGGKLTDQQVGMLTNAYESNERQLEIINQLLYVARLDAGRITLRREHLDVARLMRDVARDQGGSVASNNQHLTFKLPKRPLMADIDPHYMRMVLDNLLSNAIKYTASGGQLTMAARRVAGHVVIRVTDTGVGIDPGLQGNIFEKFTRVDNALSTDVNGSGVGLYLTKQIVELHGGNIEVRSVPGQGSTFVVRIPTHGPR